MGRSRGRFLGIGEIVFDGDAGFADVLEAGLEVSIQAALDEIADGAYRYLVDVDIAFDDVGQRMGNGLAVEEAFACQQFVEDDAEGPDVGSAVDGLAGGLLGAHVAGGAEDQAGLGWAHGECGFAFGRPFDGFGEAEIENFYNAIRRDDDVAGFQVAVDETFIVRGFQAFGDLPGEFERFV